MHIFTTSKPKPVKYLQLLASRLVKQSWFSVRDKNQFIPHEVLMQMRFRDKTVFLMCDMRKNGWCQIMPSEGAFA